MRTVPNICDFKLGTKEWRMCQQWGTRGKNGKQIILSQIEWPPKKIGKLRTEEAREEITFYLPRFLTESSNKCMKNRIDKAHLKTKDLNEGWSCFPRKRNRV